MRPEEAGSRWEQKIEQGLRPKSPGLEFSDAVESPGSEKVRDERLGVPEDQGLSGGLSAVPTAAPWGPAVQGGE